MSLRLRLFGSFALVVLSSLLLLSLGATVLMRGYVDRLAFESLDNAIRPITVQVAQLVRGNVSLAEMQQNLQEQADGSGIYLILVDGQGEVLREFIPADGLAPGLTSVELPHGLTEPVRGSFRGDGGLKYLYVAYPLARPSGSAAAPNTLVIAEPRPGLLTVVRRLEGPFVLAGVISLAISLLIAVLLTRSIFAPLAKISAATRRVAGGDYSGRITPEGPPEIQELAGSFNHMTQEVGQAQTRLRHFVADVSHELRSPLTSIQGFAQALHDGTAADDETRARAIKIIHDESRRLRHQVDEILELSRLESGQLPLQKEKVSLDAIVRQSAELMSVQAEDKDISLAVDIVPALEIMADANRLEEVFNKIGRASCRERVCQYV
jgi:signal transduction histidine kinase